jgi:hypothetical protein
LSKKLPLYGGFRGAEQGAPTTRDAPRAECLHGTAIEQRTLTLAKTARTHQYPERLIEKTHRDCRKKEGPSVMRRQIVVLVLGVILSSAAPLMPAPVEREAAPTVERAVAHTADRSAPLMRDETEMVLVGTALIGVAAAVRRSSLRLG